VEGYSTVKLPAYPGVTGSADEAAEKLVNGTLEVNEGAVHDGCHHH